MRKHFPIKIIDGQHPQILLKKDNGIKKGYPLKTNYVNNDFIENPIHTPQPPFEIDTVGWSKPIVQPNYPIQIPISVHYPSLYVQVQFSLGSSYPLELARSRAIVRRTVGVHWTSEDSKTLEFNIGGSINITEQLSQSTLISWTDGRIIANFDFTSGIVWDYRSIAITITDSGSTNNDGFPHDDSGVVKNGGDSFSFFNELQNTPAQYGVIYSGTIGVIEVDGPQPPFDFYDGSL